MKWRRTMARFWATFILAVSPWGKMASHHRFGPSTNGSSAKYLYWLVVFFFVCWNSHSKMDSLFSSVGTLGWFTRTRKHIWHTWLRMGLSTFWFFFLSGRTSTRWGSEEVLWCNLRRLVRVRVVGWSCVCFTLSHCSLAAVRPVRGVRRRAGRMEMN